MCRGELGTEVDSGLVWRHGGVPDIGVVLILVCHVLLGPEVGWSSRVGLTALLTSWVWKALVRGAAPGPVRLCWCWC